VAQQSSLQAELDALLAKQEERLRGWEGACADMEAQLEQHRGELQAEEARWVLPGGGGGVNSADRITYLCSKALHSLLSGPWQHHKGRNAPGPLVVPSSTFVWSAILQHPRSSLL